MKTWNFSNWSLSLAVAVIPLAGGCARETANAAPAIFTNENPAVFSDAGEVPGENATQDLENAPAKVVSTPAEAAPAASLSPSAAEVARLAQSGVDENVMLAFVNNSSSAFGVGSDEIIYLNDIGVPGNVVTAMIQRDQVLKATAPLTTASAYSNQPQPAQTETEPAQPPLTVAQDAPSPEANVTYTYFRDSLSPYGNWIDVEGYGQCWQPSVVVVDRGWTPYCDRGHWVYSDCGWYWASDYSWGWAPFHYGRWFRHNRMGWCWAPDTVWGPSWVSWRYNSGYCGWAPLPPTACFRPGFGFTYYGRSVSASFAFPGLHADRFTFVAANHFTDLRPFQHRLPRQQVTQIFNKTTIINPVVEDRGNPRFHRGIPPKEITAVTHTEIKQVKIRETTSVPSHGRGEDHDANRGTLTVFRPRLPEPPARISGNRIGEGVKPASPDTVIHRFDPGATMHRGIPNKSTAPNPVSSRPQERRNDTVPIFKAPTGPDNQPRNPREMERTPAPPIKRGTAPGTTVSPGLTPVVPAPKTPPVQNNLLPKRQPTLPGAQQTVPVPAQDQSPRQNQQLIRDGMQRGQPRQEKVFIAPTVPTAPQPQSRPAPRVPAYQSPVQTPSPQLTPREPRGAFSPASPAPRAVAPQVVVPRTEAPRVQPPPAPAQTPQAPAQKSSSGSDGNSRDRRQDNGNPRNNR